MAQLEQLPVFLKQKKEIYNQYVDFIETIEGVNIAVSPNYANSNHWMNLLQIDSVVYGADVEELITRLEQNGIQARPVWALNHLQQPYLKCQNYRIEKAFELVNESLCLPSSSNLSLDEIKRIIGILYA